MLEADDYSAMANFILFIAAYIYRVPECKEIIISTKIHTFYSHIFNQLLYSKVMFGEKQLGR